MCGIIGAFDKNSSIENHSHEYVLKNIKHIISRGPDKTRVVHDKKLGITLGMSTLSINNPSGNYGPYISSCRRYILTYNGEIYNDEFLKSRYGIELENNENDAHLLLKLYQLFGQNCLPLINGMFCFAIYDRNENNLLIANDPFGQKFIYWSMSNNNFLFCSSFTALKELSVSQDDFDCHFYQFENFIGEDTPCKNIKKLKPGSILIIQEIDGEKSINELSYFTLCNNTAESYGKGKNDRISDVIVSSILHCKAENSALMLSGGLDSALLAAILRPKVAVTVSFDDHDAFDEEGKARLVCERFGIEHVVLRPGRKIFEASLADISSKLQYPIGNASIFPEYLVYKYLNSRGIRICYSGVGADEFFLGYERMRIFISLINNLDYTPPQNYTPLKEHIRNIFDKSKSINENYLGVLTRNNHLEFVTDKISYCNESSLTLGQQLSMIESQISLPGLLRTTDALSGAFGIEVRSPFLMPDIVQLAMSLPDEQKINHQTGTKAPLRCLAEEVGVPSEIINDPVKRGFAAPYGLWLDNSEKMQPRGIFDRSQLVAELIDLFRNSDNDSFDSILDLVNLEEIKHA